jgi:hypothetical protein
MRRLGQVVSPVAKATGLSYTKPPEGGYSRRIVERTAYFSRLDVARWGRNGVSFGGDADPIDQPGDLSPGVIASRCHHEVYQ